MTTDAVFHALRVYVVVVSSLVAVIGTAQIRRWRTFLPSSQLAWLAVAAFNATAWYGTVDQMAHGVPGGSRTYVTSVAVTYALCAVCYWPVHDAIRRHHARTVIRRTARKERR